MVGLLRLLLLRMVVGGVVVIHGDGGARVQLRGAVRVCYAFGNGGFHFTAGVDGGRLVAILGHVAHRPATTPRRRVRPVAVHAVLAAVVGRIPDVHAVEGWEAWVRHALGRLPCRWRATIVGRWYALPQPDHGRVARVRVTDDAILGEHGGAVMLVLLVGVLGRHHTPIPEVRHVRVVEIRTHVRQITARDLQLGYFVGLANLYHYDAHYDLKNLELFK